MLRQLLRLHLSAPSASVLTSNFLRCQLTTISSLPQEQRNNTENQGAEDYDKLYKIVELEMRGNDPAVLRSYKKFIRATAEHLNLSVLRSWTPEKAVHERYTLLRSIHVNKKCRTQYEFRTYYSFLQLEKLTSSTCDTVLEYLERNLPEGVALKTTKVALEKIPDHIQPPDMRDRLVADDLNNVTKKEPLLNDGKLS